MVGVSDSRRGGTKGVPRAERERQLLDIATDEFGRNGYAATSLAAIAAAAGVSKPMTVSYFGSKEGLYLACLQRAIDNIATRIESAMAGAPPNLALAQAVITATFTALEGRPHDWNVVWDRTQPAGSLARTAARQARARLIEQAVRGSSLFGDSAFELIGAPSDPLDLSLVADIWRSIVTGTVNWWLAHPEQTAAAMTDRSARILAGIVAVAQTTDRADRFNA